LTPRPAREPFVAIPPENGGLERRPGESVTILRRREQELRQSYEEAKRALQREDFVTAERILTNVLATGGHRYSDAAQTLHDVHRRSRAASNGLMEQAGEDERNGQYDAAIEKLRRAHNLDSTAAVDGEIQRLSAAKLDLAITKLKEADARYSMRKVR